MYPCCLVSPYLAQLGRFTYVVGPSSLFKLLSGRRTGVVVYPSQLQTRHMELHKHTGRKGVGE
jgi:hypothetical protein